ncbi:hypothetical protein [Janthinobacterium agaricidamnosum]|nr:hypothetical protein [Janthinobacterium agaricidamnosum]
MRWLATSADPASERLRELLQNHAQGGRHSHLPPPELLAFYGVSCAVAVIALLAFVLYTKWQRRSLKQQRQRLKAAEKRKRKRG